MALIKCYECSKNISDTVKRCPHCGAKNIYKSNVFKKKIFSFLKSNWFRIPVLLITLFFGLSLFYVGIDALLWDLYVDIKNGDYPYLTQDLFLFFTGGFLISVISINLLINILLKKIENRFMLKTQEQEIKIPTDTGYTTNSEDTVDTDAAHTQVIKKKIIKRRSKFTAWLVAFISSAFAFIFLIVLSTFLFEPDSDTWRKDVPIIAQMIIVFGAFGVYNFIYGSLRPKKNKL